MTGLLLFRRRPILCKGEVRMKTQKKTYILALAPFLLLCILFEIIPVIYTVVRSFFPEGGDMGFTLDNYITVMGIDSSGNTFNTVATV